MILDLIQYVFLLELLVAAEPGIYNIDAADPGIYNSFENKLRDCMEKVC